MRNRSFLWLLVFPILFLNLIASPQEMENLHEKSLTIANQFYFLEDDDENKEMTHVILASDQIKESIKQIILKTGRRFFLFKYPSDGFWVKGYISFLPHAEENPLLIFLRGGNRLFGLMPPATDLTCAHNYTVLTTTYRGGVSEGNDEFGGSEVNDIYNLVEYFPILQEKIGIHFSPQKRFILGESRGGLEMFLALARSPFLQHYVSKAVSLSGRLDLEGCLAKRKDMRSMFIQDFGLIPNENEQPWVTLRNPIANVSNLRKDLPILILQGTEDMRVRLEDGYRMKDELERKGNLVTYLEVQGGNHCLFNIPNRMNMITSWLED